MFGTLRGSPPPPGPAQPSSRNSGGRYISRAVLPSQLPLYLPQLSPFLCIYLPRLSTPSCEDAHLLPSFLRLIASFVSKPSLSSSLGPPSHARYHPYQAGIMSSIVSVDDILGCPTTPQSLDDFSVSSPSSFIGSRHGSPCSYMSSETSPSSVASPPPEEVKIKSEPEVKVKTEPEQKPVKKRKSWGQQLPTPTTNLPPRYEDPGHCCPH
jgi:hypothetical protein